MYVQVEPAPGRAPLPPCRLWTDTFEQWYMRTPHIEGKLKWPKQSGWRGMTWHSCWWNERICWTNSSGTKKSGPRRSRSPYRVRSPSDRIPEPAPSSINGTCNDMHLSASSNRHVSTRRSNLPAAWKSDASLSAYRLPGSYGSPRAAGATALPTAPARTRMVSTYGSMKMNSCGMFADQEYS
jgi:hypothetical protein